MINAYQPHVQSPPRCALTSWWRRAEDLTVDETDEKDGVLIARLTAQLRRYEPEPVDETWAWPRHLGARREQLINEIGRQLQQVRDLLPSRSRGTSISTGPTSVSTVFARLPRVEGGGDASGGDVVDVAGDAHLWWE